uniref:AMP-binding enzyme n=1 Tax=Candidatus Kentrum eta TaxID=2126337 RepID=A0A450VHB3_9GAMM|nr:MAG: AMP-binding enzyme [Candidatus Kentron sp. H]VFK01137.1 MAG: AMP-binding enzyme [Candidatus Kentron sp. H]VFK04145.1 MAG: AMP-binding enzyme [Candidatus Kentron sp. H]
MSPSPLTEAERHLPLIEWNNTLQDYPREQCVHRLFEQQVARTPAAIALVFGQQQLTYGELNERANRLAHFLLGKGAGPDRLVGLCLERSPELVVGLLGILKTGAAYVPLDPAYPRERLAHMLEDADTRVLVTDSAWAAAHLSSIPDGGPLRRDKEVLTVVCPDTDRDEIARRNPSNPARDVTSEQLAYTLYTSGSTGKPKGVEIPHRALVNFLTSMARRPGLTERDTLLAVTTISFDIAGLELFLPLVVGATLVLASREADAGHPGYLVSPALCRMDGTSRSENPLWRRGVATGAGRATDRDGRPPLESVWTHRDDHLVECLRSGQRRSGTNPNHGIRS